MIKTSSQGLTLGVRNGKRVELKIFGEEKFKNKDLRS